MVTIWRFLGLALTVMALSLNAQSWSTFLHPSRAVDWTSAGFSVPHYTVNCSTQPSLTPNSLGAAAANTAAIESALASCDATHNVVNIPAGTFYVASWTYGSQGKQVVRGAGPKSTYIYLTDTVPCTGLQLGPCMVSSPYSYSGSAAVLPPPDGSGTQQCSWTAGYAQGTTTITLNSCGGTPPTNSLLILDQANDTSDTGGVYICDVTTTGCTIEPNNEYASHTGRLIGGAYYSQTQVVRVTGVSGSGGGPYTVTISPGVYFNNIRSGRTPSAWWTGSVQNDGIEDMTLDHSLAVGNTAIAMFDCYQCWVKNVRSLYGGRDHVFLYQSLGSVIQDSYFYESQSHGSQSYGIELSLTSGALVVNNIFQKVTNPIMFAQGTGSVIAYNYGTQEGFSNENAQTADAGHDSGNGMNLFEGNNWFGTWVDISWGSSSTTTLFRNQLRGWQSGKTNYTMPFSASSWNRGFSLVGNVLGQPGFHSTYESYSTSSTAGVNGGGTANTSVYVLGWSGNSSPAGCTTPPVCDPLVRSTLMRWGNWDVASGVTKWDSTEASPGSVPYLGANFSSGYFSGLAHDLPASLYYASKPSWWPKTTAWPAIGPDVSSGNLGKCSGTYAGAQGTNSAQCAGGTLSGAWASHAAAIPAQECYINMGGLPDGSGSVLTFDATACYFTSTAVSGTFSGTVQ
jgi:hypothetical protein